MKYVKQYALQRRTCKDKVLVAHRQEHGYRFPFEGVDFLLPYKHNNSETMGPAIRILFLMIVLTGTSHMARPQELGLSFSYFIPAEGYFSVPVSPFSIRGIGIDLGRVFALQTGASLYRMSGMNVRDTPFKSTRAIIGPFFSIMVPFELVLHVNRGNPSFMIKGGGFGYYNFATKVNEGNLDRTLLGYTGWEILNSDYKVDNKPGIGYHFGAEVLFNFSERFGIALEAYYLNGSSKLNMQGSYRGLPAEGVATETIREDFPDAMLDYRGYELSIGVVFSP